MGWSMWNSKCVPLGLRLLFRSLSKVMATSLQHFHPSLLLSSLKYCIAATQSPCRLASSCECQKNQLYGSQVTRPCLIFLHWSTWPPAVLGQWSCGKWWSWNAVGLLPIHSGEGFVLFLCYRIQNRYKNWPWVFWAYSPPSLIYSIATKSSNTCRNTQSSVCSRDYSVRAGLGKPELKSPSSSEANYRLPWASHSPLHRVDARLKGGRKSCALLWTSWRMR